MGESSTEHGHRTVTNLSMAKVAVVTLSLRSGGLARTRGIE